MSVVPLVMPTAAALTSVEPPAPAGEVRDFTRRLVAAEEAAWTEAHHRYASRLFRYLIACTHGDEQAAGDVLQSTFVRAVRHARLFDSEEALWSWLALLARHSLADHRRAAGRWRRFLQRWFDTAQGSAEPAPGDPLAEHLDDALAALEVSDRQLLEEKYFGGASVRTLAHAAGTTEKAIESRLSRAREKLRVRLLEAVRRDPASATPPLP